MKKIKVLCFLLAAVSMPHVIFAGQGEAQTAQTQDTTPTKLPESATVKARRVLQLLQDGVLTKSSQELGAQSKENQDRQAALQAQKKILEAEFKATLKKQEAAYKAQLEAALAKQKSALQAQHATELAQALEEQEASFAKTTAALEQKIQMHQVALKEKEKALSKDLQALQGEISSLKTSLQAEKDARTFAESALEEKEEALQAATAHQEQAVEEALTTLKTKITKLEKDLMVQKETIDHQNKALSWNLFIKDSIKLLHKNLSVSGHSFSPISEALLPYVERIFSTLSASEEEIAQHPESKELKEARRSLNAALAPGDLGDLSQQSQQILDIQAQIFSYLAPLVTQEAADPLLKHETAQAVAELEAVRELARKFNFEGSSKSNSTRSSQLSTPRKFTHLHSAEDDGNSNSIDSASSIKSRVTPKQTSPLSSHSSSAQSSQAARPSFLDQFDQILAVGKEAEQQAALTHPMHSQSEENPDISPLHQHIRMPLETPAKTQRTSEWVKQHPLPQSIMEDSEEKEK